MIQQPTFTRRGILGGLGAMAAGLSSASIAGARLSWNFQPLEQSPRRVVCFFLEGGLSQIDSFDPKPDAVSDVRGQLKTISTSVPGVMFSEAWPKLAAVADRLATVRSLQHSQNEHDQAVRAMRSLQNEANRFTPGLGAVVEWQSHSDLPVFASINSRQAQTGALGGEYRGLDLTGPIGRQLAKRNGTDDILLQQRLQLLDGLSGLEKTSNSAAQSLAAQQEQINRVLTSPEFRKMMDTSGLPDSVKDRYGKTEEGKSALLARNAAIAGMGFTFVRMPGWDMHTNLYGRFSARAAAADGAIASFLQDIDERGLMESTLTLVISEFGRSPQMDGTGRGHWPQAMSVLAAGGPVPGGIVVGDTGTSGQRSKDIQHAPDDLLASIYAWLGLEWTLMLPGEDARLNTTGSPITELGFASR